ncbi:uncharacterized protein LOC132951363 [Metopolophium dirhodum]|uniref:uncharacterized protein LOC132951363 n=1 Tax=Metopolophium dirhodum TaxID=44670 RepID=UPI00298F5A5E|nr:uncharacterized protein LOC132951363 [Metopolophium dirhodum]
MAKLHFSGEEEEQLIELVRKNVELFDLSHNKYKDAEHKDSIWLDIANTIGKSEKCCESLSIYIRDSHNRCKRKLGTGSATSAKKCLPSADRASFLNTVQNERSSTCNIIPQSEEDNVEEDVAIDGDLGVLPLQDKDSPGCSLVDKRARSKVDKLSALVTKRAEERNRTFKRIEEQNQLILNAEKHKDDDIDLFFKSLALSVKKLPQAAIKEAKLKALIMVNELEDKYSAISATPSSTFLPIQTYNNYEYSSTSSPSSIAYSMPDNQSTTSPDLFQPQATVSTSFFRSSDLGIQNDVQFHNE